MKTLKIPIQKRVLKDEEIIEIVRKYSNRHKFLSEFLSLDDNEFYERYRVFNEIHLPEFIINFKSENYPQLSANMFYIVEARECKFLSQELLRRYEHVKSAMGKDLKDKSLRGRYLTKNQISDKL